eukprot:TRINITY_DN9931_c0_g2_i1.p1 TRINITY_DN9931_c0_g2~~TRINITY_DN9931_c0_g2_i1.p1  ORF type:complete len:374 (-),score=75.51 TRINITY_DN9931_c0_g2_i1:225-1316(-)
MSQDISVGCLVKIKNLKSRTDLNGRCAKVLSFSSDSGRWECELLAAGGARREEGGYVKCLPDNLDVVLPSSSQGGGTPPPAKRMRVGDEEHISVDGESQEFKEHVNSFISHPLLQPHAAGQFLALPAQLQWAIMQRGSLAEARDPTAVLISRMNQVRNSAKFSSTPAPAPRTSLTDYGRLSAPALGGSLACRSAEQSYAQPHQVQNYSEKRQSYLEPTGEPTAFDAGVAFFLAHPLLTPSAQQQFLSLGFEQQMQVMQNGTLQGHKDPSAVLVARINGAGIGQAVPQQAGNLQAAPQQQPDQPLGMADLQAFLTQHGVQPHAIQRFQSLTLDQQQQVMSLGALNHARDPTAVFISRIQKVTSK